MNPWRGLRGLPRASWLIALATLINRAGVMVRPILVLYLVQQLGFAEADAAGIIALYGATTLVAAPLSGWLTDRFGAARVLPASFLAAGAAVAAYPLARTPADVIAVTVLYSLCNELPRPALMTLVADVAPIAQRKQAFVLSRLAINLGLAIGPALGAAISEWSFLLVFLVDAACNVAAGVVLLAGRLPVIHHAPRLRGAGAARLLRDGALLLFLAATMLNSMVFWQHDSTLPVIMTERLGMRRLDYALTITLNTLLIVLVEVELNTRTAHWSHRRSLVVGGLLTAAGFGALAFAETWPAIAATVVVWTFGEMIAMPAMSAWVSEAAPPGARGLYMSTLMLAFGSGLALAPKLGMELLVAHGAPTLWAAVAAVGVASALLYALLPAQRRAAEEPASASGEAAPIAPLAAAPGALGAGAEAAG